MPIINQIVKGGGGSAPAHYIEKSVNANGMLISGTTMINLTGVKSIGENQLTNAYKGSLISGHIDMSDIEAIDKTSACDSMFNKCLNITSVNLSNLINIGPKSGYATQCCSGMFNNSGITDINLDSLTIFTSNSGMNYMFASCNNLTTLVFRSLKVLNQQLGTGTYATMCGSSKKLESIYFYSLAASTFANAQNQLRYMFNADVGKEATNGCTVHFPKNFDPNDPNHSFDASTLAGYPTFEGSASYIHVAFDLPSTFILTGANTTEYERNPKYDTATALAWRVKDTGTAPNLTIDWTPYYTSGTTDPAVSDTIYSDSACTTTVTTISSIA